MDATRVLRALCGVGVAWACLVAASTIDGAVSALRAGGDGGSLT